MTKSTGMFSLNPTLSRRRFLRSGTATSLLGAGLVPRLAMAQAQGDTLRIQLGADIQNLDPAFEPQDYDLQVIFNIYEKLVSFRPGTFEPVNTLAKSWEPAPDGLSIDFTIKQGIQFHKGYGELKMEDVKFSFERIAGLTEPALELPYRQLWRALSEVQIIDDYTGKIVLSEPSATLMTLTIPQNAGQIVSKAAVEEMGEDYALNPVGTGPYEFKEWVPRGRVVLKKFEGYSGASSDYAEPVVWETIEFLPISEGTNVEIALETDEVDFAAVPLPSVERIDSDDRFVMRKATGFGYKFIGMNVNDPVLSEINIRKAIRAAVDVPSILVAAFDGQWNRATAILPPSMPFGYWEDAPVYDPDLDAARGFLEEAGVSDLTLTFTYNNSEAGADAVAAIVQANLAEIGITVDIVPQENAVAMQTGEEAQNARQIFYVGYGSQGDPAQSMSWFTCQQIDQWNFIDWCNDEFTELAAKGTVEQDRAAREKIYLEMQRIWDEDANVIWIAWPISYFAARKGIEPSLRPDGRMLAWNFRRA